MRGYGEEASGCASGAGRCSQELAQCSYIWWTRLKGALDGWASSIPSELHPAKALFNGKLPGSPSMRELGQDSVGRASCRRPVTWGFPRDTVT